MPREEEQTKQDSRRPKTQGNAQGKGMRPMPKPCAIPSFMIKDRTRPAGDCAKDKVTRRRKIKSLPRP